MPNPYNERTNFLDNPETNGGTPLGVLWGSNISETLREAVSMAERLDRPIHFLFNGMEFVVEKDSDVDRVIAEWTDARSGWPRMPSVPKEIIGPCRKPAPKKPPGPIKRTLIF